MTHITQMNKATLKAEIYQFDPDAKLDDLTNSALRMILVRVRKEAPRPVVPRETKPEVPVVGCDDGFIDPKRYPRAMYINKKVDGCCKVLGISVWMGKAYSPAEKKAMLSEGFYLTAGEAK